MQVWHKDAERACNVGRYCHKSNIRVKPEKGKAILWYSHMINDDTGWLGDTDPYSVHGGCDVKKGRKWIANNWISVSENRTDDIDFWIKYFHTGGKCKTRSINFLTIVKYICVKYNNLDYDYITRMACH